MSLPAARGVERERDLDRNTYYSDHYFSLHQLCSFAHQLNTVWSMKPKSILEIGIGSGFLSNCLKQAGLSVTTADINPSLDPDIVAPLSEISDHLKDRVDLVICCEVLEHMPLSELDDNLDHLKSVGDRLFLTLPNSYKTWGLGGILNLPKVGKLNMDLNVDIPWKRAMPAGHFWEVGHSPECSRRSIAKRLRTRYGSVLTRRFTLNPYHIAFVCE